MQYIMGILVSSTRVHYWAQYTFIYSRAGNLFCDAWSRKAIAQLHIKKPGEVYDNMGIQKKVDNRISYTGFSRRQFLFVVSLLFRLTEQFEIVCWSEIEKRLTLRDPRKIAFSPAVIVQNCSL